MNESPWGAFLFLRQYQYAWAVYLGRLQATVIGELDVTIEKAGQWLNLLGAVMDDFSDRLKSRPRYTGYKRVRVGTPAAAGDLRRVDADVHDFLAENWNETYRAARFRGTALGMIAGELQRRGYDLNRLKSMSIDDVDAAMRSEGYPDGLRRVDDWLEKTGVVKKQSLYSQLWAETEGARWLAVYDQRGKRAGRPYEVVTKMYRDVIAESIYQNEPFDKLRQRLVFAGNEAAIEQARLPDGSVDEAHYQAFVEEYLNRDFLRLARTETAINFNNGRLLWAIHESGDRPSYMVFTRGAAGRGKDSRACAKCEEWQAEAAVCRVFESEEAFRESEFNGGGDRVVDDSFADYAVWPGKNNVGRSFADYWICWPVHPNCSCFCTPWQPKTEDRSIAEDDAAIREAFGRTSDRDTARRARLAGQLERNKQRNRRMIEKEKAAPYGGLYVADGLQLATTCAHPGDDSSEWTRHFLRRP